MRIHLVSLLAAGLAATTLPLLTATPAAASCMMDERTVEQQIEDAEIVFVGTVSRLAHNDTTAEFEIEEWWKGQPRIGFTTVFGGTGQDGAMTSVDRTWQVGERYLVFPSLDGEQLRDNSCSPTRAWSDDLAAHRPDDADVQGAPGEPRVVDVPQEPAAEGADGLPTSAVIAITLAAFAVLVASTVAALRARARLQATGPHGDGPDAS